MFNFTQDYRIRRALHMIERVAQEMNKYSRDNDYQSAAVYQTYGYAYYNMYTALTGKSINFDDFLE